MRRTALIRPTKYEALKVGIVMARPVEFSFVSKWCSVG